MTQNFVVAFDEGSGPRNYVARVTESPFQQTSGTVHLGFDFQDLIPTLNRFKIPVKPPSRLHGEEPDSQKEMKFWTPHDLGLGLYQAFFADEKLDDCWQKSWGKTNGKLRLFLQFDPNLKNLASLMRVPWEMMLANDEVVPLARQKNFSIARLVNPKDNEKIPVVPNELLRMLVVLAEPKDQNAFQAKKYKEELEASLLPLGLDIQVLENATRMDLWDAMNEEPFQFIHFIGHGGFSDGEWGYALEDGEHKTDLLTGEELASLLKPAASQIRMVTLVSCDSGQLDKWSGYNPFGGVAGCLLNSGIDYVVAMQFPISFAASRIFNELFFAELLKHQNLDHALARVRQAMYFHQKKSMEWATPVLFTRCKQAIIYQRPPLPVAHLNTVDASLDAIKAEAGREEVTIFDYAEYFKDRKLKYPAMWNEKFLKEIWEYASRIGSSAKKIQVEGKANLSMWLTMGFVFNRTSGVQLEALQINSVNGSEETWSTDQPANLVSLNSDLERKQGDRNDLVVSISVGRDIHQSVQRYLEKEKVEHANWLKLSTIKPPGESLLADGQEALGLATAMGQKIRAINDHLVPSSIHLFLSCPAGFALFFGRELNALNQVQVYEYIGDGYQPSFKLERGIN